MKIHHVYLILATNGDGLVKIGRSGDIERRLRELQCPPGNVIKLATCKDKRTPILLEKQLHEKFALWRVPQSEMFRLTKSQVEECTEQLERANQIFRHGAQQAQRQREAEYKKKAVEQAERKAAAERAEAEAETERRRKAEELDRQLWPVERGRLRAKQPGTTCSKSYENAPPPIREATRTANGTHRDDLPGRDRRGQLINPRQREVEKQREEIRRRATYAISNELDSEGQARLLLKIFTFVVLTFGFFGLAVPFINDSSNDSDTQYQSRWGPINIRDLTMLLHANKGRRRQRTDE